MNDKDKLYIQAFERMLAEQQRLDANVKLIHKAIYAIFGVVLALLITLILSNLGIIPPFFYVIVYMVQWKIEKI